MKRMTRFQCSQLYPSKNSSPVNEPGGLPDRVAGMAEVVFDELLHECSVVDLSLLKLTSVSGWLLV